MVPKVVILSGLLVWLWAAEGWAEPIISAESRTLQGPSLILAPVAGIPYVEAVAILNRQRPQLMSLPGVTAVMLTREGLAVWTEQPDGVPGDVEGLPIKVLPPGTPSTSAALGEGPVADFVPYPNPDLPPLNLPPERKAFSVAGMPAAQAQAILERHKPELMARPGVSFVGLEP